MDIFKLILYAWMYKVFWECLGKRNKVLWVTGHKGVNGNAKLDNLTKKGP